ncbi:MAG TPA: sugar phosphate isomerase/epimerase [Granulicella sp.]
MGVSRRGFLKRAGGVAAAVVLPQWAWADPLGLPLGIQLYVVRPDIAADAPKALKEIAAIGYKEVETAGFGSLKSAKEFRKAMDDAGLKCPSAHLSFDLSDLQKTFDDANDLGCQYATASVARMMILPKADPSMTSAQQRAAIGNMMAPMQLDDLKKLADAMNTVGSAAKKNGLLFASHNHTEQFASIDGKTGLDYLITHTDPQTVKFEIDCGWMVVAGFQPGDFVKRYPGRVTMLHIKDFLPYPKGASTGGPVRPEGSEIGKGVVDYKKIFADVKGGGIKHIFVEQEGPYSRMPPMEAAKVDYAYLHSLA